MFAVRFAFYKREYLRAFFITLIVISSRKQLTFFRFGVILIKNVIKRWKYEFWKYNDIRRQLFNL